MERTQKRVVVALAISLGLNLFFVGFGVARRIRMRREGFERPGFVLGPRGFLQRAGLSGDNAAVRRVLEANRDKLHAARSGLMDAREGVRHALGADPFDVTQLDAALQKLRAHTGELQAEMHSALIDLAKTLGPAERKRLAAAPWLLDPGASPNP